MTGGQRNALAVTLLFWLVVGLAWPAKAQTRSFVPVISFSEGSLKTEMISKDTRNTYSGTGFEVSTLYFRESIGIAGNGHVYHPRFISFQASLDAGLRQEKISGVGSDSSWTSAAISEYDLWAILLPAHPYNLQAYVNHIEPFTPGSYAPGTSTEIDNRGVIFSFRQNPLFLSASYAENISHSRGIRTDTETWRTDGSYSLGPFWNTAAFSHVISHSSFDTRTTQDQAAYRSTLNFAATRIDSAVTYSSFSQSGRTTTSLDSSRFTWGENAGFRLPANLMLTASNTYEYARSRTAPDPSAEADETWNRSNNTAASLSHRLYQSLFTNYSWRSLDSESDTGSSKAHSNSLSTTYTKRIPRGSVTTGVSSSVTDTENRGMPTILDEPHTAVYTLGFPDPTFTLNQLNVIESSISIDVVDPDSNARVPLSSTMYLTRTVSGSTQITIVSLPFPPQNAVTYAFYVTYATTATEMESATFQYTLRLNLLDNLLNPYYTYSNSVQTVEAGTVPGGPDRSSSNTAGIMVQRRPYSGTVEYQDFRSRLSPYDAWRSRLEYASALWPGTDLRTLVHYERLDYPPAPAGFRYSGYTQRSTGMDLSVYKVYPRESLSLTVTGSARWSRSLLDINAYSLTGTLAWRLGLLTVRFTAVASYTESLSPTGTQTLASQYYHLLITRKLF